MDEFNKKAEESCKNQARRGSVSGPGQFADGMMTVDRNANDTEALKNIWSYLIEKRNQSRFFRQNSLNFRDENHSRIMSVSQDGVVEKIIE